MCREDACTCDIWFLWHGKFDKGGLRQAFDVAGSDLHFILRVPLERLQHDKVIHTRNQLGLPLFLLILDTNMHKQHTVDTTEMGLAENSFFTKRWGDFTIKQWIKESWY